MLEVKVERCAGIDVHKKFVMVCILIGLAHQKPASEVRRFGTNVPELERLRAWLLEKGCTDVVMESTGSYWKPVFNILERDFKLILANAEKVKALRGKKTDPNDSRWLAGLLRHGLVQPSFIPPRDIRELRDLTRRRRTLMQQGASERNRVQKILEDANVKIGNVLSDVFGMSGQAMLEALLDNDMTAEQMADLGTRTAAAENSADQRSARGPFDAGSPSPAVATNPEAYGLHRRDGRGTRQRNLAETATLRRRRQTGVFCTRDRTRCCGEHTGRNRNGYERGWPPFPVAIS